jgi:small subunit ribosomal protein S13
MARIVGVTIPDEKIISIALTYVYGLGRSNSTAVLEEADISPTKICKALTPMEWSRLKEVIRKSFKVEGSLKQLEAAALKRLKRTRCLRGSRHRLGLPVRGQRTRTNAKTVKRCQK